MYYGRNKEPKDGQLCLCRCPEWCEEGYQIAIYEDGIFHYSDQPNSYFDKKVIAWMPLNQDGEPLNN